jgi:hypothetical protein
LQAATPSHVKRLGGPWDDDGGVSGAPGACGRAVLRGPQRDGVDVRRDPGARHGC